MSSTPIGCFSWLCGGKPQKATEPTKTSEKGKSRQVVPKAGKYAFEASKQTIEILQKFGDALPIPCANQVLEVGLLLLKTCEEVTAIEQQVKELNNRISSLMLIMIDQLSGKDEKSISPEVISDIENLGNELHSIRQDLDTIAAQNRFLLIFFKNANKTAISECLDRLKDSLQTFQVARAIEDGNMLFEIENRLKEMDKTTKKIAEQVDEMYEWLKPKDGHNAQRPVLDEMPTIPQLHGRVGVIEDVANFIATTSSPRVGILGAGGMGKTSVAISVMNSETISRKYDEAHRFWVPCIGVISPIAFVQTLSKSLRVTKDTGSPLKDVLDALTSSKEPRLLLLDNMETAMNLPEDTADSSSLSSEQILNRMASIPYVGLLITIRSNQLPSQHIDWKLFPLSGVARDDARAIFTDICPKAKDDPSLDSLLEVLGYMPYAVTLMAKQAALAGIDLKDLLDEWLKNGPNALSDDLRLKMNRSIELSVKSHKMNDPDAQQLLAILSKLRSGTTQQNLKWWAGSVKRQFAAIATLNEIALITRDEATSNLFVLPVLQSYLREDLFYNSTKFQGLVLDACCKFVLGHKSSPGDANFKSDLDALTAEQVNIQAILLSVTEESFSELDVTSTAVFEAMLIFSWFQYWTKRSVELLKHMLKIANKVTTEGDKSTARYIAGAHLCLGRMYTRLNIHGDACKELETAHTQFRKLGESSDLLQAGESTLRLIDASSLMCKPSHEIFALIQKAQTELKNDRAGGARVLMALGYFNWYRRRPGEGLEVLEKAQVILEELGCVKDVSDCLFMMSRCYGQMGDLQNCLRTCEKALELSKQVGWNDAVCQALRACARCHIRLERYDEALEFCKENLPISEAVGNPLGNAQILELIGYVLAKKKEYKGARLAYERAKMEYSSVEETRQSTKGIADCDHNIVQLDQVEAEEPPELEVPMLY